MVKIHAVAVCLSLFTSAMFGTTNFMLAYINSLGTQPITTIGFYWILTGLMGLAWALSRLIIMQRAKGDGRIRLIVAVDAPTESNAETLLPPSGPGNFKTEKARWQAIAFMALSGVSASIGIFFVRQTFITDTQDQGPLAAVGSTDVMMSTLLCHFLLHERLNPKQWISVITVFVGVMVMCFGDAATENWSHVDRRIPSHYMSPQFFNAIAFAFSSSICFVCSNMSMKLAYRMKISPAIGHVVRFTAITMTGIVTIFCAMFIEDVEAEFIRGNPRDLAMRWFIILMAAATGTAGRVALCEAMKFECTGISLSIIGANSIFVLLLTAVVDHLFPTIMRMVGMLIVVSSVASMSMMAA
eukprot:GEMP01025490.1.p1 GENE.GEMP01025490.1~~GEMP01025490.1.p1  ORF type:complete len:356 (-),score=51.46 GEMP01025490.1:1128-2195(-)